MKEGQGVRNGTGDGERLSRHERGGQHGPESKGVCWWRMCRSTGSPTRGKVPIRFRIYNIRNGCNGWLEEVLIGLSQANIDLGISQGKKVSDGIYTRRLAGYSVVATDVPSRHRSGVAVFHRPAPHFAVEAIQ